MSQQIEYFALVKQTLARDIGNDSTEILINKALYMIVLGSNDYINNYMLTGSAARAMYTPEEYADLLVVTYLQHIKVLIIKIRNLLYKTALNNVNFTLQGKVFGETLTSQ